MVSIKVRMNTFHVQILYRFMLDEMHHILLLSIVIMVYYDYISNVRVVCKLNGKTRVLGSTPL